MPWPIPKYPEERQRLSAYILRTVASFISVIERSSIFRAAVFFLVALSGAGALVSCSPDPSDILLPVGDIRPPSVVDAGQSGPGSFEVLFDEVIRPVEGSFAFEPEGTAATPSSEGPLLTVSLEPEAEAGEACSLSGEAKDSSGNTTRFLFFFVGYNEDPAELRLNEIQTGKNNSTSNLHRDYIEFTVEDGGNIGGLQVQWANSVKILSYTFPPCEVAEGSLIVLHCAPEGDPAEIDECGADLSLSGGIDSSAGGRDFWSDVGGIPDETGIVLTRVREGETPADGIFFASQEKTGEVDSPKLTALLAELAGAGIWPGTYPPVWEESLQWKSSTSRPLHRRPDGGAGSDQWYVGESGSQSPGLAAPGRSSVAKKAKSPGR